MHGNACEVISAPPELDLVFNSEALEARVQRAHDHRHHQQHYISAHNHVLQILEADHIEAHRCVDLNRLLDCFYHLPVV